MKMKNSIKDFKDLKVYKKSMDLSDQIYEITKKFPKEETYSMVNQMRRAVNSISANIAEGNGQLFVNQEIKFLNIALGSSNETRAWIENAFRKKYISEEEYLNLETKLIEINKMIIALIKNNKKN